MEIFQQPPVNPEYLFSAMVGMPRRAVPARAVAGGTNIRATPAIEGGAPLHAARTSQRDVPTTLNRFSQGELAGEGASQCSRPVIRSSSAEGGGGRAPRQSQRAFSLIE